MVFSTNAHFERGIRPAQGFHVSRVSAPWRQTGRIAHLRSRRLFAVSLALGLALVAGVSSPASAETNSQNESETGQHSSGSSTDDSPSSGSDDDSDDSSSDDGSSDDSSSGDGDDGDDGSGGSGGDNGDNGGRGSDNPPVVVDPLVVTETSDGVQIASARPLPSAARAGEASTGGQLAAGGFAALAALLAFGAAFALRRRHGDA